MGNSSSVLTQNTDRKLTVGDGGALAGLFDSPLTVEHGGSLSLTVADPTTAIEAIHALEKAGSSTVEKFSEGVAKLAEGSNAIASQVASSQEQFVATASGQRYIVYALIGLIVSVAVVAGIYFWRRKK